MREVRTRSDPAGPEDFQFHFLVSQGAELQGQLH